MATVVLDVPSEKVSSFVSMIIKLGLDKHSINSRLRKSSSKKDNFTSYRMPNAWSSTVTGWDINRNELEFE